MAGDAAPLTDKQVRKLLDPHRIADGEGFRLKHHPSSNPAPDLLDKAHASTLLQRGVQRLSELQGLLYSSATWSLLVVFQGMDAAGKDSGIKHVMSGVNPQGVSVTSFKAPDTADLAHDFLYRANRALPARGMIGIFNRSHYEEVLITRVHPNLLGPQHLPPGLLGKRFWDDRLQSILDWERHLARQGTRVLKFYLHVSRAEQKRRFLDRLDHPEKNWKFSAADVAERAHWDAYMDAYESAIARTAAPHAPWFIIPADQKWFARLMIAAAINEELESLDLHPPELSAEQAGSLADARRALEREA